MKTLANCHAQVFKDLHFVQTYASFRILPTNNNSEQQSTSRPTNNDLLDLDNFRPDKHKKHMENSIKKHGGIIYELVNLIPECYYKCSYIITDTPLQTCNFFLGLTLGIPAYHPKYIKEAILQEKPFPEFLADNNIQPIPNGWCIETGNIVFRSPAADNKNLFSGYIIYLILSNNVKSEFLESILRYCGAIVYTFLPDGLCLSLPGYTTIIVTERDCSPRIAHAKVPKLSTRWLSQCLITESIRPKGAYALIPDEEE